MNDEINRLLKEKWHWENRIIELGGPNYKVHHHDLLLLNSYYHHRGPAIGY